jgi:pimeloyl-ACP methyl ester carboxylesterase
MDERGVGDPPLVLVHGVGTSREIWRRVLAELAAGRRVLAVDLPGFGASPPAGPAFDLEQVGDRLAAAVGERAGRPFDLLGHSLGGAVAVVLAARHPELIRSLVLLAPAGFEPRGRGLAAAVGLASAGVLAARRAIGEALADSPTARRALLWGAVADGGALRADDARMMIAASARATRVREAIETVLSRDLLPTFRRLPGPVGLLWGAEDRVVRAGTATTLRAARPHAPLELIAGAAHVPQLERPREFVAALGRVQARLAEVTA